MDSLATQLAMIGTTSGPPLLGGKKALTSRDHVDDACDDPGTDDAAGIDTHRRASRHEQRTLEDKKQTLDHIAVKIYFQELLCLKQ